MKKGYGSFRLWLWTFTPILCVACSILLRLSETEFMEEYGQWTFDNLYLAVLFLGNGCVFLTPVSFFVWLFLHNKERESMRADVLSLQRTILIFGGIFFLVALMSVSFR